MPISPITHHNPVFPDCGSATNGNIFSLIEIPFWRAFRCLTEYRQDTLENSAWARSSGKKRSGILWPLSTLVQNS